MESSKKQRSSIWGVLGREAWLKARAQEVAGSTDRVEAGKRVLSELMAVASDLKVHSKVTYVKFLRAHIKEACPDMNDNDLPSAPSALYQAANAAERVNVQERFQAAPRIYGDLLIAKMTSALQHGITHRQAPQVLLCLGYLVGLRANDLNTAHERRSGIEVFHVDLDRDIDFAAIVFEEGTATTTPCVGTLLNFRPSKHNGSKEPVQYATPFICDSVFYPLMREALAFLRAPETQECRCTTRISDYPSVPSGPERSQEWRSIFPKVIESFGFYEAVHEDDREQHVKFTANLGRSFVAACIEQGRFQLGPNLQPIRAVELSLGHSPLSTQNVNYLKLDVRPISQVPDVVLRDLHKDKRVAIGEENEDAVVSYGVVLVKASIDVLLCHNTRKLSDVTNIHGHDDDDS